MRRLPLLMLGLLASCWSGARATDTSDEALIAAPPFGPEPKGTACKYPIVLEHGFAGSSDPKSIWSFNGVKEALEADGHVVHLSDVPPFDTVAVRAGYLAEHVR